MMSSERGKTHVPHFHKCLHNAHVFEGGASSPDPGLESTRLQRLTQGCELAMSERGETHVQQNNAHVLGMDVQLLMFIESTRLLK